MHSLPGRLRGMEKNESPPRSSTWLPRQQLEIRRRLLPHWRMEGAYYYVTFNLREGRLTADEITVVKDHLIESSQGRCRLCALCIMPDHVHLILAPFQEIALAQIMQKFKGGSALKVNRMRGRQGPLWQVESWDRILRDEQEYLEKMKYILENPLKEGLTADPWTWHGSYFDLS